MRFVMQHTVTCTKYSTIMLEVSKELSSLINDGQPVNDSLGIITSVTSVTSLQVVLFSCGNDHIALSHLQRMEDPVSHGSPAQLLSASVCAL